MSIGARIYSYRNNFNNIKLPNRKRRTAKVKLFDLIIDGNRLISKYDDDYYVSLIQFFLKKGYPLFYMIDDNNRKFEKFFMDCLFSQNPYHIQYIYINHNNFNLLEWRKQFDLLNETTFRNLNYYNSRGNIPLDLFKSTEDLYKVILHNKSVVEKLNYKPNQCHDDAIYIINKKIDKQNQFTVSS